MLNAASVAIALRVSTCSGPPSTNAQYQRGEPLDLSVHQIAEFVRFRPSRVAIYDANPQDVYREKHVPGARWVAYDGVTADLLPQD